MYLADSPLHVGESALHARLGLAKTLEAKGRRTMRRFPTEQHRQFYPRLPYLFVGSGDAECRPSASMSLGRPGSVSCPAAGIL